MSLRLDLRRQRTVIVVKKQACQMPGWSLDADARSVLPDRHQLSNSIIKRANQNGPTKQIFDLAGDPQRRNFFVLTCSLAGLPSPSLPLTSSNQLLPIDSKILNISSQQPRWVREDSFPNQPLYASGRLFSNDVCDHQALPTSSAVSLVAAVLLFRYSIMSCEV